MELRNFVRIVAGEDVGTGYRLRPDRILTAAHVVGNADDVEVEYDAADGSVVRAEARVVWRGDERLDAAVLEFRPPAGAPVAFTHLAPVPLSGTERWRSRGCADAAVPGASIADGMVPLRGTADEVAEHQDRFELEVESPPRDVHDWRGVSGAPVFVGDRIFGVLREAPESFGGRRLYATPAHRLLAVDAFVEAVGLERGSKWRDLVSQARELLAADREAAAAVAAEHAGWREVFARGGAGELAAAVCERGRVEDVLLAMHGAHLRLTSSGDRRAARTVEEVLARIVPVLYDQGLVYTVPGEPGGALLGIPVATPTIAEIVMAAVDGRAYRYRPSADRRAYPEPVAKVASIPEPGIDFEGDRAFKDFTDHLAGLFLPAEDRQKHPGRPEEDYYRELCRLLSDELDWRAEEHDERLRRYFLFDSRFARDHGALLAQVERSLPALRLIELQGSDRVEERRLCRPLRDLLYRAQQHQQPSGSPA